MGRTREDSFVVILLCFVKFSMEEFEYEMVEEKKLGKKKKRNVKIKTNKRFMRSKILGDTGTENLSKHEER